MPRPSEAAGGSPHGYSVNDFCTIIQSALVSTHHGEENLEYFFDDKEILSNVEAGQQTFGRGSVQFRCNDDRRVYGINGQAAFFTASQLFFTTTGLRAVDASIARALAPTMDIGYLKPGHVVYRLSSDKSSYHRVSVESIEIAATEDTKVCLRVQGTQSSSFHANGFLLLSVQPDMTVPAIGNALAYLSQEQRIEALRGLKELDLLFQKLGSAGVGELLLQELRQKRYRLVSRSTPKHRPFAESLTDAKRTYQLCYSGAVRIRLPHRVHVLPELNLFEGVLTIPACADVRYNIDTVKRTVQWTRPLDDTRFEHGSIRLFEHGLGGTGAVTVTNNGNQADITKDMMIAPIKVVKMAPSQMSDYEQEDSFNLMVDGDPWPKSQDKKPVPTRPLTFGVVQLAQQEIGEDWGLNAPIMQVPILDSLCQAINNTFSGGGSGPSVNIESLYYSTVNLAGRSERNAIITMKNPALLAQLADPFDLDAPFDITFKQQLGSDLVLPILFQEFSITISDDDVSGALYRFDPTMRGSLGQRHLIVSETSTGSATIAARARTAASKSPRLPISSMSPSIIKPALVTQKMENQFGLSVEDVLNLPDYSDVVIHSDTQTLVKNAMLYHMDGTQRTQILDVENKPSVPTELPYELGDGLDGRLSSWLINTYAPAYICNQLSQVDPSVSQGWRYNFTSDQQLKIKYWWSGRGSKCLANAQEYTEISQIAANQAMLRRFPNLENYLQNSSQWASRTIKCLSDFTCIRSLTRTPIEGGVNYANMYSNIIAVLSPGGNYTSDYFNAMFSHTLSTCFHAAYIRTEADLVEENQAWLIDTITRIGVAVLDDDASSSDLTLSSEMRAALLSDIEDLESNLDLSATGTPEQRMKDLIGSQGDLVNLLSVSMSPFSDDSILLGSDFTAKTADTTSAFQSLIAKGQAAFAWVQSAYDRAAKALFPAGSVNLTLFKGLVAFGMVANYIYACTTGFSKWNTEDAAERAILVVATLQSALDCAQRAFGIWQEWRTLIADRKALVEAAMLNELGDVEMNEFASNLGSSMKGLEGENATQKAVSAQAEEFGEPRAIKTQAITDFERPMTQEVAAEFRSQQIAEYFGNPETWFGFAAIILNVGTVISMSMQLADQWNDLNTFGKTMSIIQISVTALTILCNDTIATGLVAFEFIAAESTMSVLLPGIGSVLAVVGILIALLTMVFETRKPPPPPPLTPVEEFIKDTGLPLVNSWDAQPSQQLVYTMPTTVSRSGPSVTQFVIKATNNSGSVILVPRVTFTFLSGVDTDSATLFTDGNFNIVGRTDIARNNAGNIYTDMADDIRAYTTPNPRAPGTTSFDVSVTGLSSTKTGNPQGYIRLLNGFGFTVTISGLIASGTSSLIQIVEHLVEPIKDSNWNSTTILMTN